MNRKHYMNFILNALAGRNPDGYFKKHEMEIMSYLEILQREFPIPTETIYRGILLDPNRDLVLKPIPYITFISFSSELQVAKNFADMLHPMSTFVRMKNPEYEGYLIEHTPEPSEILFHYSWAGPLRVEEIFRANGMESVIADQKEVMLMNRAKDFTLIPVQRGCSLKKE